VLLGLLDLCIESAAASGAAPDVLTTHQLAEKVIEIYWPQPRSHPTGAEPSVLRQSHTGQARIVSLTREFRDRQPGGPWR
jgi:hypothetical protein